VRVGVDGNGERCRQKIGRSLRHEARAYRPVLARRRWRGFAAGFVLRVRLNAGYCNQQQRKECEENQSTSHVKSPPV